MENDHIIIALLLVIIMLLFNQRAVNAPVQTMAPVSTINVPTTTEIPLGGFGGVLFETNDPSQNCNYIVFLIFGKVTIEIRFCSFLFLCLPLLSG
jgi:hypothetical protein